MGELPDTIPALWRKLKALIGTRDATYKAYDLLRAEKIPNMVTIVVLRMLALKLPNLFSQEADLLGTYAKVCNDFSICSCCGVKMMLT